MAKAKPKQPEKEKLKRGRGQPPKPKEDILAVFALMSKGLSIRKACDAVGMADSTFMLHIAKPEYSVQYAQAMEKRADALFDQINDIADEGSGDVMRDRLRVDARKWIVSKMLPKKYGDKMTNELTGADGKDLMPSKITIEIVKPELTKK